ncbi:uncharacterized protein LOC128852272 [Cuculus canorus]|uniref:uncharacterized protein LOC128852272 n=1 Tax=Cuculus canorus TaxID=55661 RepID=UPI0023AABD86|nr:uncharacterized protein LOC128852272 [Cuculus canorus]
MVGARMNEIPDVSWWHLPPGSSSALRIPREHLGESTDSLQELLDGAAVSPACRILTSRARSATCGWGQFRENPRSDGFFLFLRGSCSIPFLQQLFPLALPRLYPSSAPSQRPQLTACPYAAPPEGSFHTCADASDLHLKSRFAQAANGAAASPWAGFPPQPGFGIPRGRPGLSGAALLPPTRAGSEWNLLLMASLWLNRPKRPVSVS